MSRYFNKFSLALMAGLMLLPLSAVGQDSSEEVELQETSTQIYDTKVDDSPTLGSLTKEQITSRRNQRGLIDMKEVFLPRGTWIVGGAASFSTSSFDNYSILLIEDITSENYSFDVTPMLCYSVKDNIAVGFKVKYGRSNYSIDSAALDLSIGDTDLNLALDDYNALSHSYSAILMLRQYIPLGSDSRFALYCDFQLEAGGFQSRFEMNQPVEGTFSSGWNVGIGVTPGIVAFATNRVAFDVSVGVMGISYTSGEQVHNQVSIGDYDASILSFAINIFSVSMGVSVYL